MNEAELLRRYRRALGVFLVGLVLSGLTTFPLLTELRWLCKLLGVGDAIAAYGHTGLNHWILEVRYGLEEMYRNHPWIGYGTDWLAFGHVVIALFFIGPWRDPVRNDWVLKIGLVACFLVPVVALLCGAIRGIPWGWRLVDCSFGIFGAVPLCYCLELTARLRWKEWD